MTHTPLEEKENLYQSMEDRYDDVFGTMDDIQWAAVSHERMKDFIRGCMQKARQEEREKALAAFPTVEDLSKEIPDGLSIMVMRAIIGQQFLDNYKE